MSPIATTRSGRHGLTVGYAIAIAILILNVLVTARNFRALSVDSKLVARTHAVIKALDRFFTDLVLVETGQRGFLLTGDELYLEPYHAAAARVGESMARLESLIGDDEGRRINMGIVRKVSEAKLAELAETIRLRREEGAEAALAVVKAGHGRELMREAARRIASMEADETHSRERLQGKLNAEFTWTILAFLSTSAVALSLLLLVLYLSRRSRRALALNAEWFITTLGSIGDGVIATDARGRVSFMNEVAEELTGSGLAQAKGHPLDEVFVICNEATREPTQNPVGKVLASGKIQGLANHTILTAKDGSEYPIDDSAAPIRDSDGEIRGVVLVFRDISDRKADEAQRERLMQELSQRDRRKDEFLAMLGHELRNPLAAIANAVVVSSNGDLRENFEWSLDVIRRQMRHLTRMLDDLLDVSRISQGKIELRREGIDVGAILRDALETVRPLVCERGHSINFSIEPEELWADADPTRLEQAIVNLLSNSAKYTEPGGRIDVTARLEAGLVAIAVKDTGLGIEPEKLPDMFELFAQGDRSLARSEGGLGIGLTVVKKIVELHGGDVTARSEGIGKGCEFVIRIPATERASAGISNRPDPRPAGGRSRVLIVDDNADIAKGLAKILGLLGHEMRVVHDGPEALSAARDFEPEFILLDIGLPGIDGYEVARRLRGEAQFRSTVIVAITGYGYPDDGAHSRQAGFDHYMVKPVDHDALLALLAKG